MFVVFLTCRGRSEQHNDWTVTLNSNLFLYRNPAALVDFQQMEDFNGFYGELILNAAVWLFSASRTIKSCEAFSFCCCSINRNINICSSRCSCGRFLTAPHPETQKQKSEFRQNQNQNRRLEKLKIIWPGSVPVGSGSNYREQQQHKVNLPPDSVLLLVWKVERKEKMFPLL